MHLMFFKIFFDFLTNIVSSLCSSFHFLICTVYNCLLCQIVYVPLLPNTSCFLPFVLASPLFLSPGSRASSQYLAGQYGMVQMHQQQQRGTTPPSHYGRGSTPPSQQQQQYGSMARPTQRPPSPPLNPPLVIQQNYGGR